MRSFVMLVRFVFCEPNKIGQKQFTKQTVFDSHKTGKKHVKAQAALLEAQRAGEAYKSQDKFKDLARLEFLIKGYTQMLDTVLEETMGHVERKQTLTEKERVSFKRFCLHYSWKTLRKKPSRSRTQIRILLKEFIIPLNSPWAGTANPFLTGSTNSMDWG